MTYPTLPNGQPPRKIEISWDQFLDGGFPTPTVPPPFTRTVHEATAAAKAALPELNGRIDRARDLVLAGAVTPNEDGSFTVTSQSVRGKSYRVEGGCPCKDAEHEPRCKHVLATWLWRKAQQALATPDEEDMPETLAPAPEPFPHVPSLPPLPEAPASVNVELPIGGRLVRLTLRDHDETRLLARLDALLQRVPLAGAAAQEAEATAPTPPDAGWCPLHDCQRHQHTNAKGSWWSHKLDTGTWCRGKAKA